MSENESTLKVIRYDIKYHRPATFLGQLSCGLTDAEADLELMPPVDVDQVDKAWQEFFTHCEKKSIFSRLRVVNNAVCFSVFINARSKRSFDKKIEAAGLDIMGKSSSVPLKAAFWEVTGSTLGMDTRPDLEERWKILGFPEDYEPKLEWSRTILKGDELAPCRHALEMYIIGSSLNDRGPQFCSKVEKILTQFLGRDADAKELKLISLLHTLALACPAPGREDDRIKVADKVREYLFLSGLDELILAVDACGPVERLVSYIMKNGLPTKKELSALEEARKLKKEEEKIRHEVIAADLDSISKNTEASLWF